MQAGRGGLGQVGGFAVADASFAAGQGEQCLQEALLVDAGFEEFLAGGAPLLDGCAGVAQRYLQQGAVEGERGAQFVGGVGDEVPLGGEGGFQAGQQVVEGAGEFFELIVGPGQGEPLVQAGGGDPAGGGGDGAHRPQYPPGDQPAEGEGECGHDGQRDAGLGQQRVQVERVLGQPGVGELHAAEILAQALVAAAGVGTGRILLPAVARSNSQ